MNRKHGVFVYRDRWHGWSINWDGTLIQLGFLEYMDQEMRAYCDAYCKRYSFAIGLEGWEL